MDPQRFTLPVMFGFVLATLVAPSFLASSFSSANPSAHSHGIIHECLGTIITGAPMPTGIPAMIDFHHDIFSLLAGGLGMAIAVVLLTLASTSGVFLNAFPVPVHSRIRPVYGDPDPPPGSRDIRSWLLRHIASPQCRR